MKRKMEYIQAFNHIQHDHEDKTNINHPQSRLDIASNLCLTRFQDLNTWMYRHVGSGNLPLADEKKLICIFAQKLALALAWDINSGTF